MSRPKKTAEENKAVKSEYDKKRRLLKKEEFAAYQKEYRKTPGYREKQNEANRQYRKRNKEKLLEYQRQRRAKQAKSDRGPGRPAIIRTPEERAAHNKEKNRLYRERHPERRKETCRNSYLKHKDKKASYAKEYNLNPENKEKTRVQRREYEKSATRKAYKKKYYENTADRRKNWAKEYHEKNKEWLKPISKLWKSKNKDKTRAADARARAKRLKRYCEWADQNKIKEIYKNCPEGMEVDHIVPLLGRFVSGLHIESNLQYLSPMDNYTKNNRFEPRFFTKEEIKILNQKIIRKVEV